MRKRCKKCGICGVRKKDLKPIRTMKKPVLACSICREEMAWTYIMLMLGGK